MSRLLLLFMVYLVACAGPKESERPIHLRRDQAPGRLENWHRQGYLEAACPDSTTSKNATLLHCYRGRRYVADSVLLQSDSAFPSWMETLNAIKPGTSLPEADALCLRAVQDARAAGFPFASVQRSALLPFEGRYTLLLRAHAGEQVRWDSLLFSGTPAPNTRWMMRALGATPGSPWTPLEPSAIKARMNLAGNYRWQGEPAILYSGDKASFFIPAEQVASNQLMLLAGFGNSPRGLIFTGEARLHLEHLWSRAWMIHADWRSFRGFSQDMRLQMRAPFPSGLPLVISGHLRATRMDSSFASVAPSFSLSWLWKKVELNAGIEQQNHIQQYVDTLAILRTGRLPANLGCLVNLYTLGLRYRNMDHPYNPSKGIETEFSFGAGTKRIKRNPLIENLSVSHPQFRIYDSLETGGRMYSNPFRLRASATGVIRLSGPFSALAALQANWLRDRLSSLAQAGRLGGFSNLRGFNEQSIFATSWLMSTFELRYLMTANTHAAVFWNGAQTWLSTSELALQTKRYQGFGISAGFETKPGILQITWAMGQEQGRMLKLRDAQIHAGLISTF